MDDQVIIQLAETLSKGVMRAAVEALQIKGIRLDADEITRVSQALKDLTPKHMPKALADAKDAVDAHMGEAVVKATMNASLMLWAIEALKVAGALPMDGSQDGTR